MPYTLCSKSEKDDSDMKGSSSETTVFEFKDSDSEPEICNTDLHSLNEMRKDRKTVKTPSEMPVIIDQQREVSLFIMFRSHRYF